MPKRRSLLALLSSIGVLSISGAATADSPEPTAGVEQNSKLQVALRATGFKPGEEYTKTLVTGKTSYQEWQSGNLSIEVVRKEAQPPTILAIMITNTGQGVWKTFWCVPRSPIDRSLDKALKNFRIAHKNFLNDKFANREQVTANIYAFPCTAQSDCFAKYK